MKIKPIEQQLRPLLDEFLLEPDLQIRFEEVAKLVGYDGDDPEKIRISLFTPSQDGEICFVAQELYDMFLDYQILKQLSLVEPYATLLKYHPDTRAELLLIAKDMLDGKEIEVDRVLFLFPKDIEQTTEEQ